ncbi:sulfite exporter TauE/SafE family protein [Alcaligenaceae bacterium]|nr:sulfite exporter TauE/SafE family protein [Alcaligenaceae bacterium]
MTVASLAAVILAGMLIGATGIGGVLVVPALISLSDISAPKAIAASSLAFGFPGAAALWFLRYERSHLQGALAVALGAVPGAALGAALVHRFDTRIIFVLITATLFVAGLRGLLAKKNATVNPASKPVPKTHLVSIGVLVGVGSALTGTGGPVLLIPLLMLIHQPLRMAIVIGQAVQLPIALAALVTHTLASSVDWTLVTTLGVVLLLASLVGQQAARKIPVDLLRSALSVFLLLTGFWFSYTLFF